MINVKQSMATKVLINIAVLFFVVVWTIPTAGLLVSSIRDKDQLALSGWWTSLSASEQSLIHRTENPRDTQREQNGLFVLRGTITEANGGPISRFGWRAQQPTEYAVGEVAEMKKGKTMIVFEDGSYELRSPEKWQGKKGKRVFYTTTVPPKFTTANYSEVLNAQGLGQSFINSMTVTIPATIIPILIAAFAAYALAWMQFPGRILLVATIVGLLVVPLQMSLIPLLQIYTKVGAFFEVNAKTYMGIWLAHTGFGLPLAIYLLRNYIAGLPREIIESAKVDGASDFAIFRNIILPLSFPALASFAIFQFLWVWNDLLVAMVFLGNNEEQLVLTGRLREMLGSFGSNWELLTASAFITILVPIIVFFALQKYLVRGMLAGSVK
jgi:alpha-glucoside transport system permease protein